MDLDECLLHELRLLGFDLVVFRKYFRYSMLLCRLHRSLVFFLVDFFLVETFFALLGARNPSAPAMKILEQYIPANFPDSRHWP